MDEKSARQLVQRGLKAAGRVAQQGEAITERKCGIRGMGDGNWRIGRTRDVGRRTEFLLSQGRNAMSSNN